jgi:hypothetical protein
VSGLRFDGWIPYRMFWQAAVPGVEWLYLGAKPFTDPFFEGTIYHEAQTPFNSLFRFRTPLALLADWHAASPGLRPAGFIFHLSRCGSTLVTRMFAALPENLVLSEPGVVDRVLRAHETAPGAPLEVRAAWLQWVLSALAQPRTGQERRLFVKLDPRNIADLPLLLHAFPQTPWIFVYRDPVEVLVSNLRAPARFLTPGILSPEFVQLDAAEIAAMAEDEYAARVIGIVARTAARHAAAAPALLIEYTQLPGAVLDTVAPHFGLQFTPAQAVQVEQAAHADAKHPARPFAPDGEAKRRQATPRLRELAERWIAPHYARLEELRRDALRRCPPSGFPAFRRLAIDDPALFHRLRGLDHEEFFRAAFEAAARAGIALTRADLQQALAAVRDERAQRLL